MMDKGGLHVRAILDRRRRAVVVALLVLTVTGAWLTYDAYVLADRTVEQREVTVWEAEGQFTHRATVVGNGTSRTDVLPPGSTVENRSLYFLSVMPELEGEFRYEYAAEGGELDATIQRTLVIRSVSGKGRERTEYWREKRPLGTRNVTLAPGERVSVPYSVNVSRVIGTAQAVRERLGDRGQTRVSVNATVSVTGTAGGRGVNRTLEYTLPISVDGNIYEVGDERRARTFTRTEQIAVEHQPGPVEGIGGPLIFAFSDLALLALAYAQRESLLSLTPEERAWLDYRDDREDFDEWISAIRLPEEARNLPIAEADTLQDLVEFAIDTDNSVLESPEGGTYHVIHDGYRYRFEAPPEPNHSNGEAVTEDAEPDGVAPEVERRESLDDGVGSGEAAVGTRDSSGPLPDADGDGNTDVDEEQPR